MLRPVNSSLPARGRRTWSFLSPRRLLATVLIAGIAARLVRYLLDFPLWGDEAFVAVNFLLRDYQGMIEPLVYHQIAPLLFMWGELAVTQLFGHDEWALRLLPFVCGIAALFIFAGFVRRNFSAAVTVLAVGFLAASYYHIRHGAEVKQYAVEMLVSLLLTITGWSVHRHPHCAGRWTLLILLGGVSVWCCYPAIFVCGGIGLLLFLDVIRGARTSGAPCEPCGAAAERRTSGTDTGLCGVPVGGGASGTHPAKVIGLAIYALVVIASFYAMYKLIAQPHAAAASRLTEIDMWTQAFPPVTRPWLLPFWFIRIHTGYMLAYPIGGDDFGSTATLILVLAGCVALWRTRRNLLLLLLSPLLFNFVAAAMKAYPYGGTVRTSLYMGPAFCLLGAIGLLALIARFLPYPHRQRGWRLFALFFAGAAIYCIVQDIVEPYKKPEVHASRQAVQALAAQMKPADQLVVFLSEEPVDYAPWFGYAKGMGAQLAYYLLALPPARPQWAPPADQVQPVDGDTWFVVFYRRKDLNFLYEKESLDRYLATLTQRLGQPEKQKHVVKPDSEKEYQELAFYRFRGDRK